MSGQLVDLFCGGGGVSRAIRAVTGRDPDVAVNHWDVAIAVHQMNHPGSRHFLKDVREVSPREACRGAPVDLLWASPDCRDHSRAKGGKPRENALRELPDGERRVLEVVAKRYPRAVQREAIDEATGYKRSSRDTYIQRLGARKLVSIASGGLVAMSEELA